jgi:hypothetical protein
MSYTLLSETKPKARKQHRCIWCGGEIKAGEKYLREKSVYDGNMQDHAWHLPCNADAMAIHAGEYSWDLDPYENEAPSGVAIYPANVKT